MTAPPAGTRIRVMQMTDTLDTGGAERVAVNIANLLPRNRYESYLCTTRRDGPLDAFVSDDVTRLRLERRHTLDPRGFQRLLRFVRQNDIQLLHAHASSLYLAAAASLFPPYPRVVWHDHNGVFQPGLQPTPASRWAARRISGVIAVTDELAAWARGSLRVPGNRVWYLPNFVTPTSTEAEPSFLPGHAESRIVCVANLRPQKDHPNLVQAMTSVVSEFPHAHLLLVGALSDEAQVVQVRQEIAERQLGSQITMLGPQLAVGAILRQCAVGVLGSRSEGLPLALIEYGMAGLASVSTAVGKCPEVLDQGRVGVLVPANDPESLAAAVCQLLRDPTRRSRLGAEFHQHVQSHYSPAAAMGRIDKIYEIILEGRARPTYRDPVTEHSTETSIHLGAS